jgi:hypothetical protein
VDVKRKFGKFGKKGTIRRIGIFRLQSHPNPAENIEGNAGKQRENG